MQNTECVWRHMFPKLIGFLFFTLSLSLSLAPFCLFSLSLLHSMFDSYRIFLHSTRVPILFLFIVLFIPFCNRLLCFPFLLNPSEKCYVRRACVHVLFLFRLYAYTARLSFNQTNCACVRRKRWQVLIDEHWPKLIKITRLCTNFSQIIVKLQSACFISFALMFDHFSVSDGVEMILKQSK